MNQFKSSGKDLVEKNDLNMGKTFTEKEIWGQPLLWQKIFAQVQHRKQAISSFINEAACCINLQIILTGAGTSAFVGLSLIGAYKRNLKKHVSAVSTTDLITHPFDYFHADIPVLLISFARSGESPESVATTRIADQICTTVYHLIVTCDASGALANYETNSAKYVFVLPEEANDKGLAMTGSYSGMLLSGLLISRIAEIEALSPQLNILVQYGQKILDQSDAFKTIAKIDFERVVFLGSGPLFGTATESHLKVQELTNGKIICKKDSFLGFRHGPIAVINKKTLILLLLSNQSSVAHYETDLIGSLNEAEKPLWTVGITESGSKGILLDQVFELSETGNQIDEEFLSICFVLPAQMLGFYKSLQLGLNPDNPSVNGSISRVVQGVIIYPLKKN